MNLELLLLALLIPAIALIIVFSAVIPRRLRAERRARELLAQHAGAERTLVYVAFDSCWPRDKRDEIDARIGQMHREGWTFLRAREASPLRTICSWGGGANCWISAEFNLPRVRGVPVHEQARILIFAMGLAPRGMHIVSPLHSPASGEPFAIEDNLLRRIDHFANVSLPRSMPGVPNLGGKARIVWSDQSKAVSVKNVSAGHGERWTRSPRRAMHRRTFY